MNHPELATRVRKNCPFCLRHDRKRVEGEYLVINRKTGHHLFRVCGPHQQEREENPRLEVVLLEDVEPAVA